MNDKTISQLEKETQSFLKEHQLDSESILKFRNSIHHCSSEESLLKGKEIHEMLTQQYPEAISFQELEKLILEGADVNYQDEEGNTLLMHAISLKNAELLLRAGADPSIQNNRQQTALFPAARNGNSTLCYLYLHFGVDVNHQDIVGDTSLFVVLRECRTNIFPLAETVRNMRKETIEVLTTHNAYLNIQNYIGETISSLIIGDFEKEYFSKKTDSIFDNVDPNYKTTCQDLKQELETLMNDEVPTTVTKTSVIETRQMEKRKVFKRIS